MALNFASIAGFVHDNPHRPPSLVEFMKVVEPYLIRESHVDVAEADSPIATPSHWAAGAVGLAPPAGHDEPDASPSTCLLTTLLASEACLMSGVLALDTGRRPHRESLWQ